MTPLLNEMRHNPVLWLLALVPVVLIAERVAPAAHTLLFLLSLLSSQLSCFSQHVIPSVS